MNSPFLVPFCLLLLCFFSCLSLPKKENPVINACDLRFTIQKPGPNSNAPTKLIFRDPRIQVSQIIYDDLSSVSEDWIQAKKNGKFGFIDLKENVVMDFEFSFIGDFHDGYAVFREGEDRKGPRGFLNKKGDLLGGKYYDMTYNFQNGYGAVELNRKYGLIDRTGKIVVPIQYDLITGIHNGWAVFKREEHQGLVNAQGIEKKFVHDKYDLRGYFYAGTIVFKHYQKSGIMDSNFNVIIPPIYDYLGNFQEGLVRFELGDKWGFLDQKGKVVIEAKFDSEYDFEEGYATVEIEKKSGIINQKGEYLIEPKYESISNFENGLAVVQEDGKKGFINRNGEWVVPPVFQSLTRFREGVFTFALDGKWGFVNLRGCQNK
ncbi:WG repeat-containing protein [Leptospira kemamanensis]|uniref:WG repeat-containing protein n=1 Tax=Leptospira kemamanensis TaxID=2484942 RepID=A0A4V3JQ49_9LEPT|nr:WG repeat-containing protein [Leptospira kemamanensis]